MNIQSEINDKKWRNKLLKTRFRSFTVHSRKTKNNKNKNTVDFYFIDCDAGAE